jgi:hypothetical protein
MKNMPFAQHSKTYMLENNNKMRQKRRTKESTDRNTNDFVTKNGDRCRGKKGKNN